MIRFNQPFLFGEELVYLNKAVADGRLSGNGDFTKRCHSFFESRYGFNKVLLTTSCTDALEMAAILLDIKPGDEVIMPSFTFVSTSNAFVLRGANIVFADSEMNHPNIDASLVESLITERTKALVVVHYGGVACDMDQIMTIAKKRNLFVVEDAAQAIDSYYKGRPLGSIGDLAAFSFHETKNVVSGEGGMLVVNTKRFASRAEIIWEKGTNRSSFFRGEVDKYGWVDIGSSFLPSDLIAAYLFGQLEHLDEIQTRRLEIWNSYFDRLEKLQEKGLIRLPKVHSDATNNAHVFFLECGNIQERTKLLEQFKTHGIGAVFHYLSLHKSPFYEQKHDGRRLPNADRFADCLVRLPLHLHLTSSDIDQICDIIEEFYQC
ncbi:dTDP-4-amino-4,6-dideoxygalactose transaminase [Salibacteraceae bacterium]|nr:dTDP-4-amino-4,6-dideoxygalactose transaminase [Salibacteraceae bacterium]MDB9709346.1 dTDP-4-amino-4,6-dideoxygalactose transaminase [Salibacteraceae bacterium]HAQ70495.1 dTDP-4-amino-4,6-dideoxygalactose transaminase [Flavobacteriales bacterium]